MQFRSRDRLDNVMPDSEEKTSKFLMAWDVAFHPGRAADRIKIDNEKSFGDALEFAAWCLVALFGVAAAGGEKDLTDSQRLWAIYLAANGLIYYPLFRPFSWRRLTLDSFIHIYCYMLTFEVLKSAIFFYFGKTFPPANILVSIIDIWKIVALAFFLKHVLKFEYWKFALGFVIGSLAIGLFLAVFAPSLLHQLIS